MTVLCYRQTELGEGIGSWLEPTSSDALVPEGLSNVHSVRLGDTEVGSSQDEGVAERLLAGVIVAPCYILKVSLREKHGLRFALPHI